jgi:hypothetical protein
LTGTAPTPAPAPPPAELRCRCGRVLGTVDRGALVLGEIRVLPGGDRVRLNLECPRCGYARRYCVPVPC